MHIAFSATDSYVDYMGTAIYSIIQHHPQQELHFHILTRGFSKHSRFKLSLLESELVSIDVIEVNAGLFEGLPLKENISLETYFRILLPNLLPQLPRILYLDCDILVKGDLTELWQFDLNDSYLAGVNELDMLHRNPDYRQKIGFETDDIYVNAGVLLLDLAKMRKDQITELLFEKAEQLKDSIDYQDQDIINISLKEKIAPLPSKYNMTAYTREANLLSLEEAIIVHFNWHKPWRKDQNSLQHNRQAFHLYRSYYQNYRQLAEQPITLLVNAHQVRPEALRQCLTSIQHQAYQRLDIVVLVSEKEADLLTLARQYLDQDHRFCLREMDSTATRLDYYKQGIATTYSPYLIFVDAEDWLDADYVSGLYRHLYHEEADICLGAFTLFNEENGIYSFFEPEIHQGSRTSTYLLENLFGLKWYESYRHLSLTGKIYRRQLFSQAHLINDYQSEDLWSLMLYLASKTLSFNGERTYVKRLKRVEEKQALHAETISLRRQELLSILTSLAVCKIPLHHVLNYYQEQLQILLETAWQFHERELVTQLEADLNRLTSLKLLASDKP